MMERFIKGFLMKLILTQKMLIYIGINVANVVEFTITLQRRGCILNEGKLATWQD